MENSLIDSFIILSAHSVGMHSFGFSFNLSLLLRQRMQDLPFFIRRLTREMMDPERSLPLFIRARVFLAVSLLFSLSRDNVPLNLLILCYLVKEHAT